MLIINKNQNDKHLVKYADQEKEKSRVFKKGEKNIIKIDKKTC